MANAPVLVDSSWYIRTAREGRNPLRELLPIATVRDVATCSIVRAEVARGIKDPAVLEKFQQRWDVMLHIPTDHRLWADVEKTAWQLDRTGKILPLTDIIIACCARRIGAVVLTHDRHFDSIPGIVATERIV
jgi:predicted nucleic acid-binding protein